MIYFWDLSEQKWKLVYLKENLKGNKEIKGKE